MFHVFGKGEMWVKMCKPSKKNLYQQVRKDLIYLLDTMTDMAIMNRMMDV
jgi:hypothetical protein